MIPAITNFIWDRYNTKSRIKLGAMLKTSDGYITARFDTTENSYNLRMLIAQQIEKCYQYIRL